jgi:hypothetical protein
VSFDDVRNYFKGEHWKVSEGEDGFDADSEAYEVRLKSKGATYDVEIAAADDPSDSDTKVTDDPVEFISKFLGTGTEADDILKKMSSFPDPSLLSRLLIRAANLVESEVLTVQQTKRIIRRGIVATFGRSFRSMLAAVVRAAKGQDVRSDEMTKLQKTMKEKGWKVSQHEDDKGHAVLEVDVSGVYTATIKLDSLLWNYEFQVNEMPESKDSGVTDDPIQQFRLFYKKDSTQDAKSELKKKRGSDKQEKQEEGTKPAGPAGKKKDQERKDSGKTRDQERDETGDTMMAPTQLPPSRVPDVPKSNKYSE